MVQFASTGTTVNENVGTVDLTLQITDEDATNDTEVDVVLITGSAGRVNSYTTQTVTFPGGSSADETVTITVTDNSLCDGNTIIGFELQNITGGQGTAFIGANDTYDLSITDDDVCTGASFQVTSATVSEGVGTYDITVELNAISGQDTDVDVVLTSGNAARIDNYTTQTVTILAANLSQNLTITVTDNGSCDGTEALTFELQNISGGSGTPFIGPNGTRTLDITDNDGTLDALIARQAFDGLGTDTWGITAGGGNISTAAGGTDTPANERILSGTASWQVNNASSTLDLGTLDVNGYSNVVLTARVSSTSATTSGNGADNGDIMDFFVDLNGAGFPGTADIRIEGNGNARWGYSTGLGVASTTAGTPASFQPSSGGTITTEGYTYVSITIPDNSSTVALRVTALNNSGNEVWNLEDIEIRGDYCATTYYSRADGNVGDAIWSETPSGSAGSVTFDRFKTMVVQNGDVVNLNANTRVDDLTIDAGGQLDLASTFALTVSGDLFDNNGTLTAADNSTLVFNSPNLTTVESTSTLSLFDLTANTPGDLLTDAAIEIRGTMLLADGEFDASLGSVTLVSDNSGTGRLGPVSATADFTGDMTVQRYIPAGATNWRFLGSPVAGQTVNDWKDDFYTAGFPGSHSPTFSNPVGSGILWPSIRWYDETLTFAHIDTGWVGVSSIAQTLDAGQGFAAWCGTSLNTTTAFTIDVTGAPNIASTTITRSLDYTNNGAPTIDGWNAVSNPLPSPVLFSSLGRTNVEDYVYIFNPAVGNVAAYDVSSDISTNGGNDTIQSSQAFMVQAIAGSASISFDEADKVNDRQGGFFGGSQQSTFNGVRLKLTSGVNTFSDETVVAFGIGTPGVDGDDVPKMTFSHPDAPQIASRVGAGLFAINATAGYTEALAIPILVDAKINGSYTVTASNMENIGLRCLVLEDLETGTMTPLVEGASYTFSMAADASNEEPRLLLHASVPVPLYADATTCYNTTDGRGTVVHVGEGPIDITWTDADGVTMYMQTIAEGVAIVDGLAAGEYHVAVSSDAGCGALSTSFTITAPTMLEVESTNMAASCPNTEDGRVDLTVLGGTAPYQYAWSDGSTEEDLVAAAGTYTVTVMDDNGCTVFTPEFTIGAGEGPTAMAEVNTTTVLVNVPVSFVNTGSTGEVVWTFGDGQFSTEAEPSHTYAAPGTYTVTMTVTDGDCSDTWTAEVMVETSTGIQSNTPAGTNAWFANDKFVVEHAFNNGQPVTIEVLDATGRLHLSRQVAGTPARVNVPAEGLSTGIWFVRVSNAGTSRTMRVPLVR
ncbi:MAG: PKD domain-containing protein [Flavobacteriales bacterium]|nr:PKD domain-containing protein [Flavobacteriales bacterium]